MKVPKIEYDIYYKKNGTQLQKLNLSICDNKKILLSIPVTLTENLEQLNSSSGYYNDICYTTTSESGTDILLNDRHKDFCDKNKMLCQEDCDFIKYDNESKRALCSCDVKESSSSFSNMKINKTKLFKSFIEIDNIANINILKCNRVLLSVEGIIYNIGSYILIFIFLFHIVCLLIFYLNQLKALNKKITDISYGISNINLINFSGNLEANKNIQKTETKNNYKLSKSIIEDKSRNKIFINSKKNKLPINKNNKKKIKQLNNPRTNVPKPINIKNKKNSVNTNNNNNSQNKNKKNLKGKKNNLTNILNTKIKN